jgi:hypothetical protein
MQSKRSGLSDVWALLAVAIGLCSAATCLADDWPAPLAPPVQITGQCRAMTAACCGWAADCINNGDSHGYDDQWFTCTVGGAIWPSIKVDWSRQYGICDRTKTFTCNEYQTGWYCVRVSVFRQNNCGGTPQCQYFAACQPVCDPLNP